MLIIIVCYKIYLVLDFEPHITCKTCNLKDLSDVFLNSNTLVCLSLLTGTPLRLRLPRLFGTIATSSPFQKKLTITFMIPLMAGRHLFPSAKLSVSSQWLSQDISLFFHEISLSLEISVHKSPSLFNF